MVAIRLVGSHEMWRLGRGKRQKEDETTGTAVKKGSWGRAGMH